MKIVVKPEFWTLFPEGQINVLIVDGLDNHKIEERQQITSKLLQEAAKMSQQYVLEEPISENPVIQQWRTAFTRFRTKKGARSSIEALLKRAKQGHHFTPINPLVDLYNCVSLIFGVPCGGEDLDKIQGDLYLGKAQGGETFYPLGAEHDAPALPDEIIYYDKEGAVCRCLNWREAQRTMLTEETKRAILVIESIYSEQVERGERGILALQELVENYLSAETQLGKLMPTQSEFSF